MNNEGFRKLLRSGNLSAKKKGGKSTKEIAREAVEAEYKERRRKRGRDDDYLSDDDYDDEDDDRNEKKNQKSTDDEQATAEEEVKVQNEKKKARYRNRARERREGKVNKDYQNTNNDIAKSLDEEMTKYLGGDEEHTHLVKGLDKTLAEKVRREEMQAKDADIDLDQVMEEASARAKTDRVGVDKLPQNVSAIIPNQTSSLTTGMLSYLKKLEERNNKSESTFSLGSKKESISQSGQVLLRTSLKFTLDSNVKDRDRSWILPEERMISTDLFERMQSRSNQYSSCCTPLDTNLIAKINRAFNAARIREANTAKYVQAVEEKVKSSHQSTTANKHYSSDSSDDDIFADVGEYMPPSKSGT